MKKFACADVVPGWDATLTRATDYEILIQPGDQILRDHQMAQTSPAALTAVRSNVVPV